MLSVNVSTHCAHMGVKDGRVGLAGVALQPGEALQRGETCVRLHHCRIPSSLHLERFRPYGKNYTSGMFGMFSQVRHILLFYVQLGVSALCTYFDKLLLNTHLLVDEAR